MVDGIDRIDVLGDRETKDKSEQDDEDFNDQDAKNNRSTKASTQNKMDHNPSHASFYRCIFKK